MIRECEVCGKSEKRAVKARNGMILCQKHYIRFMKGKDMLARSIYDPNEIIKYDNYAEIVLYNRYGVEKGRSKIPLDKVDIISKYKWCIDVCGYVKSNNGNTYIHRLISEELGEDVDHINGDKLNNTYENLRSCLHQQNLMNQKISITNKSGTTGVWWSKKNKKWYAEIMCNYKKISLGSSYDINDAIKLRKEGEEKYFGEYARRND